MIEGISRDDSIPTKSITLTCDACLFDGSLAIPYHNMPAAYLMVAGGVHPRGRTNNQVTPLGGGTPYSQTAYDAVAKAFYFANTECLTPRSTFETIRFCMVEVHEPDRPEDIANIAEAWTAVGVVVSTSKPNKGGPRS